MYIGEKLPSTIRAPVPPILVGPISPDFRHFSPSSFGCDLAREQALIQHVGNKTMKSEVRKLLKSSSHRYGWHLCPLHPRTFPVCRRDHMAIRKPQLVPLSLPTATTRLRPLE